MKQVSSRHPVWVLTDVHNRPGIERELRGSPMPAVRFVYVTPFRVRLPIGFRRRCTHLYYLLWQIAAYQTARRLHEEIQFDLAHHVTYVNPWMPSFLGWLGVPFIWSAGIREKTPLRFLKHMSWRSRLSELGRNLAISIGTPLTNRCTASRARFILSGSEDKGWDARVPVVNFPLGGLDSEEIARLARIAPRQGSPFRIASIGRLAGLKGFGLGILAFARIHHEFPDAEYWIIGDGPERKRLEALARRHGCGQAVRFAGGMARDRVFEELARADVVLHPSLHEQFGYAGLEAMIAGRPVICLNAPATNRVVSGQGGLLVPTETPDQVVNAIHAALRGLIANSEERRRIGARAREWGIRQWAWNQAGGRLLELYEQAVRTPDERAHAL